jgi:nitrogen regulatory protein PII-like uncharacterized protein
MNRRNWRWLLLIIAICFNPVIASSQATYHVKNEVTLTNSDNFLSKIVLIMPLPESNNYQMVRAIDYAFGQVRTATNNDNKYLRETVTSNLSPGTIYTLSYNAQVLLYPMHIDMDQFTTLYPYDVNSDLYKRYTSSRGVYIDNDNPDIRRTADRLWSESKENIIDYAYACYMYAAGNFDYLNANTGIHPIARILSDRGGDCGNLSSIFINLLRVKGIPARHIVMVRPNGTYHVVADFYLERYGWIPVDVTLKHDYPSGNYFGYHSGDGIVMSIDLCSQIEYEEGGSYEAVLLQTYYFWYWRSSGEGNMPARHNVTNSLVSEIGSPVVKFTDSRNVTLECDMYEGITHFHAQLYRADNPEVLEKEYRFESSGFTISDLSPETNYIVSVTTCRMVENIETTINSSRLNFRTTSSPTSVEKVETGVSIHTNNKQLIIQADKGYKASVYSSQGQLILTRNIVEGTNIVTMNSSGVYILKLTDTSRVEHIEKISVK